MRDLTDLTIAVDVNAPAEPLYGTDGGPDALARAAEPGDLGQGTPELLPDADPAGAPDTSRVGYRRRISEFVESLVGKRERVVIEREPGLVELFASSLDIVQETIRAEDRAQRRICSDHDSRNRARLRVRPREQLIEIGRLRTREALARWEPPRRSTTQRG